VTTANEQLFVVTVLKGNIPTLFLEIDRSKSTSTDVEIYHKNTADLMACRDVLEMAYHACGYELWKLSGQLPLPLDIRGVDLTETPDTPPF